MSIQTTSSSPGLMERLGTDAVALAACSGFGYVLALQYERGFCSYFGVPEMLIAPTVPLIATGVTLVLSTAAVGVMTPFVPVSAIKLSERMRSLITSLATLAAAIAFGLLLGQVISATAASLVAFFAMICVASTMASKLMNNAGRGALSFKVTAGVLVLLGTLTLAPIAGRMRASITTIYYTLEDQRDFAVIRNYGDVLVAVRVDRVHRRFLSEVLVLRPEDGTKIRMYREELGRFTGYSSRVDLPIPAFD